MHKNNFDFLRLIFALLVLVTHSYALTGLGDTDPLAILTDHQVCLSYIGVRGFFIISGYLIFQSLLRSKDILDYFWKRVLRLFPAMLVMLALTVLLGPLAYDNHVGGSYWRNPEVWSYFPNNASLYRLQFNIKGIFENNPYPKTINGSLWTICYEFTCYMALAALIFIRRWQLLLKVVLGLLFVALFMGNLYFYEQVGDYNFFINSGRLFELAIYFVGGSLLAAVGYERFRYKGWMTLGTTIALAGSLWAGHFLDGFHFVLLPIWVIGMGAASTPYINAVGKKLGDLSYGIYIYGFPVQQALIHFFGMSYLPLMVTSIPITMLLGYASWHGVEKRALKWKKGNPTTWIRQKLGLAKG